MNLIEEFNRLNSPGIISHLVKLTGMPFDRINAGLRDGDFTEDERVGMEKGFTFMDESLMIEITTPEKWDLYNAELKQLKSKLELEIFDIKNQLERSRRIEELPELAKSECIKKLVQRFIIKQLANVGN